MVDSNIPPRSMETLSAITRNPTQGLIHAQRFFKSASPEERTEQGGAVIQRMIHSANYLQESHPGRAFVTVLKAQELAKTHLPDGPARVALRDQSFETMGRIASLAGDRGNGQQANAMFETAHKNAGGGYQAAITRGIESTMPPELQCAKQAQSTVRPALQQHEPLTMPKTEPTTASPATMRSSLNDVSSAPHAAVKKPGIFRRVGQAFVFVAAAKGALLLGQEVYVRATNSDSATALWATVTTSDKYATMKNMAGYAHALTTEGAGLLGTISQPKVSSNADNPYAMKAAHDMGVIETREAAQRQTAHPKAGTPLPNATNLSHDIHEFRLKYPHEFEIARQSMKINIADAVETVRDVDSPLGKKLSALAIGGEQPALITLISDENIQKIQEQRAKGQIKPAKAPTP
jgi:hypothetical protein